MTPGTTTAGQATRTKAAENREGSRQDGKEDLQSDDHRAGHDGGYESGAAKPARRRK